MKEREKEADNREELTSKMMVVEAKVFMVFVTRSSSSEAASKSKEWTAVDLNASLSYHVLKSLDIFSKEDIIEKWEDICRKGLHPLPVER